MDLNPVIAHLKQQIAGVRQIGAVADLVAATDGRVTPPALFVLPGRESAIEEDLDGDCDLRVTFSVVSVVANRRDSFGGAAQIDLEALRRSLDGALNTLILPGTQVPPRFTEGSVLHFSDGQLWWADEYVVDLFNL